LAADGIIDELRRGNVKAKMVFDTSGRVWQRRASAFDGSNGRQQKWWQLRMTMMFDSGSNRQE